ncbi:MAG: TRAP transporter small permease [Sneathiella sp.]|nr:TRAP transporter small permease [Sneathiella sp.]
MTGNQSGWARAYDRVHRICEVWALIGGLVLLSVVLVNAYSICADLFANKPFPGDFEITEVGVAIAIFCFLPYCQITGSNVSADIFTAKAGKLQITLMSLFAGIIALGFSSLLLWRMSDGFASYLEYEEVTGILGFPIWVGFIPCLFSLGLLVVASFMTIVDLYGTRRRA